jgi:hypothetical protein
VKRWLERRHGEATEELLLGIAIEDWERIETVRQKRDAAVIPVTAHALSRGDEESVCGLRARQASPTTRWADHGWKTSGAPSSAARTASGLRPRDCRYRIAGPGETHTPPNIGFALRQSRRGGA